MQRGGGGRGGSGEVSRWPKLQRGAGVVQRRFQVAQLLRSAVDHALHLPRRLAPRRDPPGGASGGGRGMGPWPRAFEWGAYEVLGPARAESSRLAFRVRSRQAVRALWASHAARTASWLVLLCRCFCSLLDDLVACAAWLAACLPVKGLCQLHLAGLGAGFDAEDLDIAPLSQQPISNSLHCPLLRSHSHLPLPV